MHLRPTLTATLEALFPPVCPVCRLETGAGATLCPECWSDVAFLGGGGCRSCGRPMVVSTPDDTDLCCDDCQRHPPIWHTGRAVFSYEAAGRKLVLGLKHGDRLDMVPMLATWLARAAGPLLPADLVVPVPLHWTRRLKRRCNHMAEVARALAPLVSAQAAPRALIRTRRTGSQDGKNRAARIQNLADAITAPRRLDGQRIIVLDDVLTTGATLNACSQALLAAGAANVDILVLALVQRDADGYIARPTEDADDETG